MLKVCTTGPGGLFPVATGPLSIVTGVQNGSEPHAGEAMGDPIEPGMVLKREQFPAVSCLVIREEQFSGKG